jgi:hypothetical protein
VDHPWLLVLVVMGMVVAPGCTQLQEQIQDRVSGTVKGPGSKYPNYLNGQGKLLVELDYAPGNKPDNRAIDALENQLNRGTPRTVTVTLAQDLPSREGKSWSVSELKKLTNTYQDNQDNDPDPQDNTDVVVMHGLYVDGKFGGENGDTTIGLAYETEAFAIFMGKVEENTCSNSATLCTDKVRRYKLNRAITVHEAGHLVGLVDSPLPMVNDHNDDPQHPAHSSNSNSVMFWKVESTRGLSDLFDDDSVPYKFDNNDVRDMKNAPERSR